MQLKKARFFPVNKAVGRTFLTVFDVVIADDIIESVSSQRALINGEQVEEVIVTTASGAMYHAKIEDVELPWTCRND